MTNKQILTEYLYNGTVEIDFHFANHEYRLVRLDDKEVNIRWIPSVTGVTGQLDKSAPLIGWAVKTYQEAMKEQFGFALDNLEKKQSFSYKEIEEIIDTCKNAHREKKEKAADVGTVLHRYAQIGGKIMDVEGFETLDDNDKIITTAMSEEYDHWWSESGLAARAKEQLVYSKKYGFCGTFDLLAVKDRKLGIVDYKTGKDFYEEQLYQLGGYFGAREEEYPDEKIHFAYIVRFCKIAQRHYVLKMNRTQLKQAYTVFKSLLAVKKQRGGLQKLLPKRQYEKK